MTTPQQLQLAGMALRNGVLVLGPTSWAVAVRGEDAQLRVTSGERPQGGERLARRVPLLRGPVSLVNMLRVLPRVRRREPAMRLAFESPGVAGVLLGGMLLAGQVRRMHRSVAIGELVGGGVSLVMTLATMRSGEVSAYHGAEHKAIGGYEQGITAAQAPRQHPRCGTQLALPMIACTSLATALSMALAPTRPRTARVMGQLVGVVAATELVRASLRRDRSSRVARVAARAGRALQTYATTSEPSRTQLDVAEAALEALLAREHAKVA